jgi:transketolase
MQLFLSGYGLELADIEALRTWGSLTPAHPEVGHTPGVEATTGPLGQGVGMAVGMAMAGRRVRGLLDRDAETGESPFDHRIYVLASDGDLEEGVSSEASSFAGTQRLNELVLMWDDNHISIDDDTNVAFTEDVLARYAAYGWHVQFIDRLDDGDIDVAALDRALLSAREVRDRPSFIAIRSTIGWPAPTLQNTFKAHGNALGADEVAATKRALGFNPDQSFFVDEALLARARRVAERGAEAHRAWDKRFADWQDANAGEAELFERMRSRRLPEGWVGSLPTFDAGGSMATRKASGAVLNALGPVLPELWGGSADLAESNNTLINADPSAFPLDRQSKVFPGNPFGRNLHFGVREHGMGAILNGIALEGTTRPYGATFLIFSDYMRPAVRLAALMRAPVTYIWTHDSIGLGEDGSTHQPVEHLASLRAIPGLSVVRPADANETVAAWRTVVSREPSPTALILSRQNLPVLDPLLATFEGVSRGAYVLAEAVSGAPEAIIVATGSEVSLALAAREVLESEGTATRVVSMPCREWFDEQPDDYRDAVLPATVRVRVSVEAGVAMGWREVVGEAGRMVSLEHFGASADAATLFRAFGFTPEAVVDAVRSSMAAVTGTQT